MSVLIPLINLIMLLHPSSTDSRFLLSTKETWEDVLEVLLQILLIVNVGLIVWMRKLVYLRGNSSGTTNRNTVHWHSRVKYTKWVAPATILLVPVLDPKYRLLLQTNHIIRRMTINGSIAILSFCLIDSGLYTPSQQTLIVFAPICFYMVMKNLEFFTVTLRNDSDVLTSDETWIAVLGTIVSGMGVVYLAAVLEDWFNRVHPQQNQGRPSNNVVNQSHPYTQMWLDERMKHEHDELGWPLNQGWIWELNCGCRTTNEQPVNESRECGMIGCDAILGPEDTVCGAYDSNSHAVCRVCRPRSTVGPRDF